jgi:hypothetical protein
LKSRSRSGYTEFAKQRLLEYEAYLKLFSHIEWSLSSNAATVKEWSEGYKSPPIEATGFLAYLRGGTPIKEAYIKASKKSVASPPVKELLLEFFSEYGKGYLSRELTKLKHVRDTLTRIREEESVLLMKNIKLYRILLFTGALGIVILTV